MRLGPAEGLGRMLGLGFYRLLLPQDLHGQLLLRLGLGLVGLQILQVLLEQVEALLLVNLVVPGDGGAHHHLAGALRHELLELLLHQDVAGHLGQVGEAHGEVLVGGVVAVHRLEHSQLTNAEEEGKDEAQDVEPDYEVYLLAHQLLLLLVAEEDQDAVLPRGGRLVGAEQEELLISERAQDLPGDGDGRRPDDEDELEVELQQDARARHLLPEQVGGERPQRPVDVPLLASLLVNGLVNHLGHVELGARALRQAPVEPFEVHDGPPREVQHPEEEEDEEQSEGGEEGGPAEEVIVAARPVRVEREAAGALHARVRAVQGAGLAARGPAAATDASLFVGDGLLRVQQGALRRRGADADEVAEHAVALAAREQRAALWAQLPLVAVPADLGAHSALQVTRVPPLVRGGAYPCEDALVVASFVVGSACKVHAAADLVQQVLDEAKGIVGTVFQEPQDRGVVRAVAFTSAKSVVGGRRSHCASRGRADERRRGREEQCCIGGRSTPH
mmetsp:Transcript_50710/g.133976  ORF Transcript_50710/g.133976 Transcript_50710/m.133976 type:complete len:504 (-) Transcript_50710:14-1525(-)